MVAVAQAVDVDNVDVDPAILARAAAADAGQAVAAAPASPPGPAVLDLAADEAAKWLAAALQYGAIARTMLPDHVAPHWTDERLEKLGQALARCAAHYGWRFGGALTHPLAMLIAAGFPLAWPIAAPYVMPRIQAMMAGKGAPAANDATAAPASSTAAAGDASSSSAPPPAQ